MADELISELDFSSAVDRAKEEKNILRRVYDALNVLISAGVLVKHNKRYCWQGLPKGCGPSSINEKIEMIENKRRENALKRDDLRELTSRYYALA